jgi:predicted nucleic acid-binding protein
MVSAIVDSAVIVDLLRGYTPAILWINQQNNIAVTSIVEMEVLQGALDKRHLLRAVKQLNEFDKLDMRQSDLDWATQQLRTYRLSHQVSMMDCLIASVGFRLEIPVYTRNLKHFRPLIGRLALRPY